MQVVALSATFGDSAIAHVLPMMKRPRRFDRFTLMPHKPNYATVIWVHCL